MKTAFLCGHKTGTDCASGGEVIQDFITFDEEEAKAHVAKYAGSWDTSGWYKPILAHLPTPPSRSLQIEHYSSPAPTVIEKQVCEDIANRQAHGFKKYGQTVADNPLPLDAWLQHAYEEALDFAVYLKRAKAEIATVMEQHRNRVENSVPKDLLKSIHEWFIEKAPEHYKGCGLCIDVEYALGIRKHEDDEA